MNNALKMEENQQSLSEKAQEFLNLARETAEDSSLPDRFEKTVEYFEQSLRAERNPKVLIEYAEFLEKHDQITIAFSYYEEALEVYRTLAEQNSDYLSDVADTLNKMAIFYFKVFFNFFSV